MIGFGAGEPDFAIPAHIVREAARACAGPSCHGYSSTAGLAELRAAIATKTARDSGHGIGADQVLVTNGANQAVFNTSVVLCEEGDDVLVPMPAWPTFLEAIALTGASPVPVVSDAATGFRLLVDQLERLTSRHVKALLIASPANPMGAVYSREEVQAIAEWATERGLRVITDEIYEHLTDDAGNAPSFPVVFPDIADHCIVINGVSKSYVMTGWRVGWMIGPGDVVKAVPTDGRREAPVESGRLALADDLLAQLRAAFELPGADLPSAVEALMTWAGIMNNGDLLETPTFGRQVLAVLAYPIGPNWVRAVWRTAASGSTAVTGLETVYPEVHGADAGLLEPIRAADLDYLVDKGRSSGYPQEAY